MDSTELAALVQRARDGDTQAFTALYEATGKHIRFLCTDMLRNEQDAEDAVQEVYLTAYKNLHRLREPEKFRSWLAKIAVNHCRNQLKKHIPVPVEEDTLAQAESAAFSENLRSRENREVLLELMQQTLSGLQYRTVVLYYFEQYSVSEVAAMMGCSENAVKNRLNAARNKLRKCIRAYEEQNEDKLHSTVPLLTALLSEEANIPTERMVRPMLNLKMLIGAGAAIIAVGGAGVVLHLQKNAPPTPVEDTSPTESLALAGAQNETLSAEETAAPETEVPETAPEVSPPVSGTEDASLYDKGLEVIALMAEECRNESWLSLYAGGSVLESEAFAMVQSGDYAAPQHVYRATLAEENTDLLFSLMDGRTDTSELSAPLHALLRNRTLKSWINVLNARMGVDYVAVGGIISAEAVFVNREITENCIYIYTYENACPVAVVFTMGDGGAVMASGHIILAESFETDSAEAVANSMLGAELSGYDFALFEVVEVN